MKKTKPIGVRFRLDVFEELKINCGMTTPQKALVFLEQFWMNNKAKTNNPTQNSRYQEDSKKPLVMSNLIAGGILEAKDEEKISCAVPVNREAIIAEIEALKTAKIPAERDTSTGRQYWKFIQNKKIKSLEDQLKQLNV